MSDKLNFSLPEQKKGIPLRLIIIILLGVTIAVGILNIIFLVFSGQQAGAPRNRLNPETQKELALRLQNNGLAQSAAKAWQEYFQAVTLDAPTQASIYYTIGKLYQDVDDYEQALLYYYRSEAAYKREDLSQDIGYRIQECLESLGKFAALRQDLKQRTALDSTEQNQEVLAQIGTEKITRADLDRMIEQEIDLMLSQVSAFTDSQTLNQQKEQLFKRYSGEEGRINMLNQHIITELLYRKARQLKLSEESEIRQLLKASEREVLAQGLLNKKKAENIKITENDLKNYYEANIGSYIEEGVQKSFNEVRDKVYQALWQEKSREIEQNLITELKDEYNVVINYSQIQQKDDEK